MHMAPTVVGSKEGQIYTALTLWGGEAVFMFQTYDI